ncbi:L-threonylcarbamoyladenylate synthase [Eoetvoesiella caeni]|uniref:Threonylcarbamoyl-AMP synthase n=1 Tax=Eoetvoesiella caeni TaxID=645616 RepID=A0A366HAT1_9BURK|nr:L-threonylcarbamoyladenylate synthase [Eoetvoesiella caeni]MCI2809263.1 threonylcarbamoyl-AMP synthase [Eoetvoesiella caeni]NYT54403.1 threonylcarbamoyl-AMP synthase [Eoetvoesiella caeni]RBP39409.1 translation factor SUA5 [Eoetvoesiella caeni]
MGNSLQDDAASAAEIERAAGRLIAGGLVAFPTETVYGLGGDAENPQAIERIYAAKGRPSNHPVIVHLAPQADIGYWVRSVPPQARLLIDAFWPGPLTLILPRAAHIPSAVSGGQDSIGLRCPSHPVAQALLREFARRKPNGQGGVAAPSANKFGQVSPTRAEHVRAEFPELLGDELQVLEGGQSEVGIESTILDLSRLEQGVGPVLLRPGHVSAVQLAQVLGMEIAGADAAAPRVSGSLKAHYAPRTPLLLLAREQLLGQAEQAARAGQRVAAVLFNVAGLPVVEGVDWVAAASDPKVYASELYALLRRLDRGGYNCILLEQPPQGAAWLAVNDRIGRAAAAFL